MRQLKITKQITNRDAQSFNKYLTDVSNEDTITPEEEIELAKRIQEGDEQALEKLVKANLRFVISVAKQYNNMAPLPDLVNEGNFGLIKAAQKFDHTRGFKFISYAVWWIRQTILQYLAENQRTVRLPSNRINMVNSIKKATGFLEQRLERMPTADEISEYLNDRLTEKGQGEKYNEFIVKELITLDIKPTSIDAPMTNESDSGTLQEVMEGSADVDIDKINFRNDLQIEVARNLQLLKPREKDVLILYFGLFDTTEMTLAEIGEKYDLTRERVRQIKEKGIRKLKMRAQRGRLKEYTAQ